MFSHALDIFKVVLFSIPLWRFGKIEDICIINFIPYLFECIFRFAINFDKTSLLTTKFSHL